MMESKAVSNLVSDAIRFHRRRHWFFRLRDEADRATRFQRSILPAVYCAQSAAHSHSVNLVDENKAQPGRSRFPKTSFLPERCNLFPTFDSISGRGVVEITCWKPRNLDICLREHGFDSLAIES